MKEKKVSIGDKEFVVKELLYKDVTSLTDLDKSEMAKKMLMSSVGLSEEEYNSLTMSDGVTLQQAVNELNGLSDFQDPLQTKE